MHKMSVSAQTVYQSTRDVNVVNHFGKKENGHIAWIIAIARSISESIIIFDGSLRVIYMNNTCGTFDGCTKISTINDIVDNISDIYQNPEFIQNAVELSANYLEPRNFYLHMVDGVDVFCRSYPVIDQGILAGIVLTAWKNSITKRQVTSTYTITA